MRSIYEIIHICTAVIDEVKNELTKNLEYRTGIAEVTGSNPVETLFFFFRLLLSNCLSWKIYCDDHSSLSSSREQTLFCKLTQSHMKMKKKIFLLFMFSRKPTPHACV